MVLVFLVATMSFPSLEVFRTSFNIRDDIVKDIKSAGRRDETNKLIESWVLDAKLSEVVSPEVKEHPWLTQSKAAAGAGASKGKSSSFVGCAPVGFMILSVRNVTAPKINPESSVAPRMLKVTVTDGYQTFHLIELETCNKLSLDTAPGAKIVLTGEFIVRNNLILIKRNNVLFVGGVVEEMYEKWQVNQKMALKGTSREQGIEGSGAPKFVPFGCKIDKLGIDPSKSGQSEKEENGVKTEEDLKFDASREKKLEALKDLKSKADQKSSSGAATTQLPDRDFFRKTQEKDADKPVKTAPKVVAAPPSEPAVAFNSTRDDFRGGRRGRGGRNRNDSDEDGEYKRPNQSASLFDVIQNKMNEMSVTEKPKPGDNLARQFVPEANNASVQSAQSARDEFNHDLNRNRGFSRGSAREEFSYDANRGRGFSRGGPRGNSSRGGGNRYGSGYGNAGDRPHGDRGRGRGRNQRGNFRGHGDVENEYEFDENDYPLPNQSQVQKDAPVASRMPESTYPEHYNGSYYDQHNSYYQPNMHAVPVVHDVYVDPMQGYMMHPQNMMQANMQHPFQNFPPMPPFQQPYGDYDHQGRGPPSNRGGNSYQTREFTPRRGRYNSNNRY